jgi:hypothetical protein
MFKLTVPQVDCFLVSAPSLRVTYTCSSLLFFRRECTSALQVCCKHYIGIRQRVRETLRNVRHASSSVERTRSHVPTMTSSRLCQMKRLLPSANFQLFIVICSHFDKCRPFLRLLTMWMLHRSEDDFRSALLTKSKMLERAVTNTPAALHMADASSSQTNLEVVKIPQIRIRMTLSREVSAFNSGQQNI